MAVIFVRHHHDQWYICDNTVSTQVSPPTTTTVIRRYKFTRCKRMAPRNIRNNPFYLSCHGRVSRLHRFCCKNGANVSPLHRKSTATTYHPALFILALLICPTVPPSPETRLLLLEQFRRLIIHNHSISGPLSPRWELTQLGTLLPLSHICQHRRPSSQ